jgi:hypothetical protein
VPNANRSGSPKPFDPSSKFSFPLPRGTIDTDRAARGNTEPCRRPLPCLMSMSQPELRSDDSSHSRNRVGATATFGVASRPSPSE